MSLYLKYRPSDFDNLMWQKFVKDTLRKAIADSKTVGAYLLCWPRWTGKTTTARLLAKTINCLNPHDWNPCLQCEICKEFATESLIDIIEIDAASHTWVDNIRELIERAQFSPTKAKYKIYIIDEVHMLSKWAFNALLKILEEPPSHVKFILATTETHKVPDTIISRCQRYDFKRISDVDIKTRLEFIALKEGIEVDEQSYNYIIKNSNWWLRNAISLFEQMISDSKIIYSDIVEKLWIISENETSSFLEKLLTKDSSIVSDFDKLISDWKNIKLFFKELIFFIKKVALDKLKHNEQISDYIKIIDILDETYTKTKNSLDENTTFIIWVLKIVTDYNHNIKEINKPVSVQKKEIITPKIEEKKVEEIVLENKTEELSWEDIFDVFGTSNDENNISVNSINTNNSSFDSILFIDNLKKSWAKWAITMALRWAKIDFSNSVLNIKVASVITKRSLENADSISLMHAILGEMWFNDIKINLI